MRARLQLFVERISGSYWFVPTVMAFAAAGLAFGVVALDLFLGTDWLERYTWVYANKPAGARALLAAIAGSMITVAGVVFSTTIATVTYASAQFGPRLLTNFMHDRANQVVLGTFTATFLYCLLVLRTIRSADEDAGGAFVPHLGVLGGVLLAIASIGVLIFFVHHTPRSMHASHVAARIARELRAHVAHRYPERIGHGGPAAALPSWPTEGVAFVTAARSGYVQHLNPDTLLALAQAHDLVLYLPVGPGAFVAAGTPLAAFTPAAGASDDVRADVAGAFVLGSERTPAQDTLFLVDELVEVSARALSPGVNDPFTAINCLDWLFDAALDLTRRHDPSALRYDEAGVLRVVARPVTFERFTARAFESVWPYVSQDRNTALHALHGLAKIAAVIPMPEDRACVGRLADSLHRQATDVLTHARPALDARRDDVHRMVANPSVIAHLDMLRHLV